MAKLNAGFNTEFVVNKKKTVGKTDSNKLKILYIIDGERYFVESLPKLDELDILNKASFPGNKFYQSIFGMEAVNGVTIIVTKTGELGKIKQCKELIVINGIIASPEKIRSLTFDKLAFLNVKELQKIESIKQFGADGLNGAIVIETWDDH